MPIESAATWDLPTWPSSKAFPLTDDECVALCRGDLINPGMTAMQAIETFPFRFEMKDGWMCLKRE